MAKQLFKVLQSSGFGFMLSTKVTGVRPHAGALLVDATPVEVAGPAIEPLACDAVLVSIGRKPNTDGLALESANLKTDAKGFIPVDPKIARLLARYPLPNNPQGPDGARTYASSSRVTTVSDQASARIDHRISSQSQLLARFTMENTVGPLTNPSQTVMDPSFAVGFTDQQRNGVVTYTRTRPSGFVLQSSVSFTRATPAFPTLNRADPALTFGDGLYEAFNAAAGSVQAAFGNLFQVRQDFTWIRGKHTFKSGGEVRANRDTTYFGISPNGQYQFGGGAAYSPVPIHSLSGGHDIPVGGLLPDALSGLLTASAFTYTTAVAPPQFAQGSHIGDSAIHRDAYNFYFQDSWKISGSLVLNYGLRYEIPAILKSGGGAIVNMSSILGSVGFATAVAYTAAKHALVGMTKVAAMEYAPKGLRVNAVGPGFIDTPLLSKNLDANTLKYIAGLHPIQRLGRAEEVSALTCFLLSDRASFITGSYHLVDGGFVAQ